MNNTVPVTSHCSQHLKAAGKPYPRTCPACGPTGKCPYFETVPVREDEFFVVMSTETIPFTSLRDAARYIQEHMETGDQPLVIQGKRIEISWEVTATDV